MNLRRFEYGTHACEPEVGDAFGGSFRKAVCPWKPAAEVHYGSRTLQPAGEERAFLHAKCAVVRDARAFVTSANLTTAAHGRNIQDSFLLGDAIFARALRTQFESLIYRSFVRLLTQGLGS